MEIFAMAYGTVWVKNAANEQEALDAIRSHYAALGVVWDDAYYVTSCEGYPEGTYREDWDEPDDLDMFPDPSQYDPAWAPMYEELSYPNLNDPQYL